MSVRLGNVDQLSALFADSFRMAVRRARASPPHTNAMMTIMVIQVAVVIRAVPFGLRGVCVVPRKGGPAVRAGRLPPVPGPD